MNLLSLLLNDSEVFTKTVVFVNTRLTAEKVYNHLKLTLKDEVAILNPIFFESFGLTSIEDFYESDKIRVLIVANELKLHLDLTGVPFIIQAELPEEKEMFIGRILQNNPDDETMALTFTTDLELPMVRKIEQAIGQRIPVADLPENLIIDVEPKENENRKPKTVKSQNPVEERGAAFHEKKASNSKNYNYSSGLKAKMNKKKNH